MSADSGIAVVDKPPGITSHGVVGRLRRHFGTRKVGHAGTLDPMATGVLVAGVNRATRLLGHLALTDKAYLATIRLGQTTITDDAEGDLTGQHPASHLDAGAIEAAVARFRGSIEQVPSAVSAIKVEGKRSYARVRAGEQVQLKARPVTVSRFDVTRVTPDGECCDVEVAVECSTGTYVRALARDVGEALGVGGHLTRLRRTRVGPFTVGMADDPPSLLPMGEVARLCFAWVQVDAALARRVSYGHTVPLEVSVAPSALLDPDGGLLALYEPAGDGQARPVTVFVDPHQGGNA